MSVCTFFGHRDCFALAPDALQKAIETLIAQGVDTFYLGHQGRFDAMVLSCLRKLKERFSHIQFSVVLAYMPTAKQDFDPYEDCGIYPEGMELVHPRFAIEQRNKWMLRRSDHCLCYIDHPWGGAYKFARMAQRRGLTVINLGSAEFGRSELS